MYFKLSIITILFFILAFIQYSFLPKFWLGGGVDLVFLLFFTVIFFEQDYFYQGIFFAVLAGFLSDVFSPHFFGLSVISCLLVYGFTKIAFYFLHETRGQFSFLYFTPLLLISLLIRGNVTLLALAGNFLVGLVGFFVYKYIAGKQNRQLKLL